MERIATNLAALGGGEQETMIEMGIVTNQHRSGAALLAERLADPTKHVRETIALAYGSAQRAGRIDAVKFQRGGLDVRAFERIEVHGHRVANGQALIGVERDEDRSELEERVALRIEAACLDIHDNGQESAESSAEERRFIGRAVFVRY